MSDQPYDFDKERGMRNPAAWKKVKAALGDQYWLDRLFRRLEIIANGHTARYPLAFAIHAFVSMTLAQRLEAQKAYFLWVSMLDGTAADMHKSPPRSAPATESLPDGEQVTDNTVIEDVALLRACDGAEPQTFGTFSARSDVWTIRESATPLNDDADWLVDHPRRVVWLAPGMPARRREIVIPTAVAHAVNETHRYHNDDEGDEWKRGATA